MKKNGFLLLVLLAICGCADDRETALEQATVRMSFYQMEAMTRTATPIGEVCSRLDVWLIHGTDTISIHQQSTDADFGSVGLTLDKTLTYQLVAIAHKSTDAAVLADGVIRFADEKVTHSMVYTGTFCPGETTVLNCEMMRIVGMLRLETTDAVPDEVVTISFAFSGTGTRWDIVGTAANTADRETTIAQATRWTKPSKAHRSDGQPQRTRRARSRSRNLRTPTTAVAVAATASWRDKHEGAD